MSKESKSETPITDACEENILQYGPLTEPAIEALKLCRHLEKAMDFEHELRISFQRKLEQKKPT